MNRASVRSHTKIEGVYWASLPGEREQLATLSLAPGTNVYGETCFKVNGNEYRIWDPYRSKLAAAIWKGLSVLPLKPASKVLYLGAASGTTVSHVSDLVGSKGRVYCIEFAQRSFRELVNNVCQQRPNTTPILEDARFPGRYRNIVPQVDAVYSDVAQPDQGRIIADNLDAFLNKPGGFLLCVKSRSIDVTKDPSRVFDEQAKVLEQRGYKVAEMTRLDPYEMDHCMIEGSG